MRESSGDLVTQNEYRSANLLSLYAPMGFEYRQNYHRNSRLITVQWL